MKAHSVLLIASVSTLLGGVAEAHHSFAAAFEANKQITLAGTVTKVEWTNPHAYFYLAVKADGGRVVNWICETAGPNTLLKHGWARDSLKIGDMVKVIAYPARGGSPVASAREVTLSNGRKMVAGSSYDGGP